jgi:hypothetical protein
VAGENALLPIATMIHLILGVMTIILVYRSEKAKPSERLAALVLGWTFFVLGVIFLFQTIIDYQFTNENITTSDFSDSFLRYGAGSTRIVYLSLIAVLPLIYPYPVFFSESFARLGAVFVGIFTILLVPLWIVTNYEYSNLQYIFFLVPFLVWIGVYLRYLFSEIQGGMDEDRTVSAVAALLLIGVFGEWLTYWLGIVLTQENHFTARGLVGNAELRDPTITALLSSTMAGAMFAVTIVTLFVGEAWRTKRKGFSGVSTIIFTFFTIGILWFIFDYTQMGIVDSCVNTTCEELNPIYSTWYVFSSEIIRFLVVPLILMYVILNFNLIETGGDNVWFTRIMVLLMLLIVTSSIIELIQTVLPIPQMITSALFAAAVVVFIGWEEKITNSMIRQSISVSDVLIGSGETGLLDIDEGEYRIFSVALGISMALAMLISLLISLMEITV